jgi:predicted HD superfamily hydrolase involved in NAD metabolism
MAEELVLRKIESSIGEYLSKKRIRHTLGVKDTAVNLSRLNNCSEEKAAVASLLHDIARDISLQRMQDLVRNSEILHCNYKAAENDPRLLHAYAGKAIAKQHFNIHDDEILRSIELHTTGGGSMSVLDKIIFVADYIEPGRKFSGVKTARTLAYRDLDEAVLYIFRSLLRQLLVKQRFICQSTLTGYNELVLKRVALLSRD